jgi:hypothetical protein
VGWQAGSDPFVAGPGYATRGAFASEKWRNRCRNLVPAPPRRGRRAPAPGARQQRAGQKEGCSQASIQMPVPTPTAKLVIGRSAAAGEAQGRPTIGTSTGKGQTGRANARESLSKVGARASPGGTQTLETSGHEPVHLLSGRHPGLIRRRRARAGAGAVPPDQGAVALRRLPLWAAAARAARAGPARHRPALAAAGCPPGERWSGPVPSRTCCTR